MSAILKSPPSLCSITILFEASTDATMLVNPAVLIAPATTSASLDAPVVTIPEIVTSAFNASCATIPSCILIA